MVFCWGLRRRAGGAGVGRGRRSGDRWRWGERSCWARQGGAWAWAAAGSSWYGVANRSQPALLSVRVHGGLSGTHTHVYVHRNITRTRQFGFSITFALGRTSNGGLVIIIIPIIIVPIIELARRTSRVISRPACVLLPIVLCPG